MRGKALSTLRTALKAELREAQQVNAAFDAELNLALAHKQRDLAFAYDWEFLKRYWKVTAGASTQFVDIPTSDTRGAAVTINWERPVLVERLWNTYYAEVDYGIGAEQYNAENSDDGDEQDPIQRWQFATNTNEAANADEIEVWPVPQTAQTLRFTGQRNLLDLLLDTDTADLDDLLIVYHVAADYLALRKQANAPLVLRKAQERLLKLRAGYPTSVPPVIFGRHQRDMEERIRRVPIAVA